MFIPKASWLGRQGLHLTLPPAYLHTRRGTTRGRALASTSIHTVSDLLTCAAVASVLPKSCAAENESCPTN